MSRRNERLAENSQMKDFQFSNALSRFPNTLMRLITNWAMVPLHAGILPGHHLHLAISAVSCPKFKQQDLSSN
jgi:hypothetical protein